MKLIYLPLIKHSSSQVHSPTLQLIEIAVEILLYPSMFCNRDAQEWHYQSLCQNFIITQPVSMLQLHACTAADGT